VRDFWLDILRLHPQLCDIPFRTLLKSISFSLPHSQRNNPLRLTSFPLRHGSTSQTKVSFSKTVTPPIKSDRDFLADIGSAFSGNGQGHATFSTNAVARTPYTVDKEKAIGALKIPLDTPTITRQKDQQEARPHR